tara:strand:- start:14621 stop:14755 length:135 start_codon:yes stop_codon:yes gene_type:complete
MACGSLGTFLSPETKVGYGGKALLTAVPRHTLYALLGLVFYNLL